MIHLGYSLSAVLERRQKRGFRVIEYVAKNNSISLPKNIRQVGDPDPDKRVYIEDYAFSFIKELVPDEDEEGRVGLLLGEERTEGEETYVFVRGALEVINASVYDGRVAFTEETWPAVNAAKNTYFGKMDIVGWFLVSSSIKPENNIPLERTHIDSFGRYKLLLHVNPAEQSEEVYTCFDQGLEPLDGYMVYFEKNEEMQTYMAANKDIRKKTKADDMAARRYRQIVKESSNEPKSKQQLSLMYVLSAILVILVLVIGVGRLQAEKGLEADGTVAPSGGDYVENTAAVNATPAPVEDEPLNVDYANGNVSTTAAPESEGSQPEETVEEPATEPVTETEPETTTEEPTTEAETTTEAPTHRTYVIQQGDTLYDILMREYGSLDKLQELFDLNGITDGGNSIDVGDELLLP